MIASLARQPAWVDSMTPGMREELVRKLESSIQTCESPREIASVTKAIAALERADIDKARLFLDAEKQGTSDSAAEIAEQIRGFIEAARAQDTEEGEIKNAE